MKSLIAFLLFLIALSVSGADNPLLRQFLTTNANPMGSYTNNGAVSSNAWLTAQSSADWQRNMEVLPWRGMICNGYEDSSNKMRFIQSWPTPKGYNIMMSFEQFYATNRTAGHLTLNQSNFPVTIAFYQEFLRTNGFRLGTWYDSQNATAEGYASLRQYIDDIQTIANTFKPQIAWVDEVETTDRALIAAALFSSNTLPVHMMFGSSYPTSLGLLQPKPIMLGNGWRLHGSTDVSSFVSLLEYFDLMESNGWKYVGPGQFPYFGPEAAYPGTATENATSIAGQAMMHGAFLFAFNASIGPLTTLTNEVILRIQHDPAMVCARRVAQTNGCWIYLMPLGTPAGPDYALFVMNTNAVTTNTTITFAHLGGRLHQGNVALNKSAYHLYNWKTMALVGVDQTSVAVTSLASHDYALYKLTTAPFDYASYSVQGAITNLGAWLSGISPCGVYDSLALVTNASPGYSRINFTVPHGRGSTNMMVRVNFEGAAGIFDLTAFTAQFAVSVCPTNGTAITSPTVNTNFYITAGKGTSITLNMPFADDVSARQVSILPLWTGAVGSVFTNAGVSTPLYISGFQVAPIPRP